MIFLNSGGDDVSFLFRAWVASHLLGKYVYRRKRQTETACEPWLGRGEGFTLWHFAWDMIRLAVVIARGNDAERRSKNDALRRAELTTRDVHVGVYLSGSSNL